MGWRAASMHLIVVGLFASLCPPASSQPPPAAARTIDQLRGDLYVARFDSRATIVWVTADGIVVGDPLSVDAATWLRAELAARFPGRSVQYVLHSHYHFDRAAGASVFDPADSRAHRAFNVEVRRARSSSYADVRVAKRTFDTRQPITLAGRQVEMIHTGRGHAPGMSALYFPDERVVFVVDPPELGPAPFVFPPYYSPHEVAVWLEAVTSLDADLLVSGDGTTLDPVPLRQVKRYIDDLIEGVTAAVTAGKSLSEIRRSVLLPAHRDSPHYPAREAHVEAVYRALSVRRWSVSGGVATNQLTGSPYCDGYATCEPFGTFMPGGSVGLMFSTGRFGISAEAESGRQVFASRSSRFYDDSLANRRTTLSTLSRYRIANAGVLGVDLVGGLALVTSDTRGLDRVKEAETPVGGRHPIVDRRMEPGFSVGAELSIGATPRLAVRIPVRWMSVASLAPVELHPGRSSVQFGVGLAYRLSQRVSQVPGRSAPVVSRGGRSASPAVGP